MITGFMFPGDPYRQTPAQEPVLSSSITRLLAAAVINRNFRDLLLTDPGRALSQGFQGETFPLDYQERNLVLSIQADSLRDFATQLSSGQDGKPPEQSQEWIPEKHPALIPGT